MKKISYLILLILIKNVSIGQPWLKRDIPSATREAVKPNLKDISRQFDDYWRTRTVSVNEEENAEEGTYQQFRRWEWLMKSRTYPDGYFFNPQIAYQEYQKIRKGVAERSISSGPAWDYIGPDVIPLNNNGVGRLNVIRFNPQNASVIYVGAACGGVWKSTNGGSTWTNLSDFLPSLSIADIAINPRYPDSIFVATGDGYGYESDNYDFWGGLYTAGVLVSGDGGQTWAQTGWGKDQADRDIIQRLQINPADPDILVMTTRNGIFRSVNAGQTWTQVRFGHFYDIEFRPGSADTLFTSNGNGLFRSINRGQSFTQISSGLGGGRVSLALTPANPNVIYSLSESGVFKKSVNGGTSFTLTASQPGDFTNLYGYYGSVLVVSPTVESTVFAAGLEIVRSTDSGANWRVVSNTSSTDRVHVDFHALEYAPNTSTLYAGTDGGIWRTPNAGINWTNLSNGLGIKQYYRISHSSQNPYTIYAGAQDNGTDQFKNGVWTHVTGGDGMDNAVNTNDDNYVITSYQYGQFLLSSDGGNNFNDIAPSTGAWVTPIIVDAVDGNTFYAAYQNVWKSTDNGNTWNQISTMNAGDDLIALAVSGANTIYAANQTQIWVTHDGGNTWNNIKSGLPADLAINYISVSPSDSNDVWVGFSGYDAADKVFHSTDGGIRWENFSVGLPNVPVNCVMVNPYANQGIFAGTDLGVYYSEAGSDFTLFGTELPNVMISDLDVIEGVNKIRAGTYGRGIWEADIPVTNAITEDAAVIGVENPVGELCSSTFTPVIKIKNFGANDLTSLTINYGLDGDTSLIYQWNGTLTQGSSVSVSLPSITTTNGNHDFVTYCSMPNGIADLNAINDLRSVLFSVSATGVALPVTESFEGNTLTGMNNFYVVNTANMLAINGGGSFNQSSFSIKAGFFNSTSGTAILSTRHLDFTNALNPLGLSFDYAYAPYSANYHDSLFVKISTDCGATWTTLVEKGDTSLQTAAERNVQFYPLGSEWERSFTDLSAYNGFSDVVIRFEFKSGFGNNLYVDNINILPNFNSVSDVSFDGNIYAFPNPFSTSFRVAFNSSNKYLLTVADISGRVVYQVKENGTGQNLITIPADAFASGSYLLTVREENGAQKVIKLIKE